MKAYTGKNNIIDTIGDHVGGNSRPILFASSSRRRQHLPTPPRQKLRGSIGSSCFGCARYDLRSKERSRLSVPLSQYAPNDSARVGEGRSGHRGRVLSQSHTVAWERRRREPGYNPVIDTTTLTSGEGHVVEDGISQRVRKILAGVPASVSIRDLILALSFSRSKRQYWTVGNRPIRKNDLRSLHRISVEAQIQDRSRQKTGLNTAPAFSRVYNKPPLRAAKGTRAQHAGDARKPPTPPLRSSEHQDNPSIIPPPPPSFPRAIRHSRGLPRHSRGRGNPVKTKHTAKPPLRGAKGTRAQHAGDARKPPTPPLRSSEHQDNPSIIPPPPPSFPRAIRHSRGLPRHSREPSVIPASLTSFPRTREPRKNKAHRQTSPSLREGDACAARRGCPKTTNSPPFEAPNTKTTPPSSPPPPPSSPHPLRHSRKPSVIPASLTSFPQALRHSRGRGNPEKNKARHFHPNPHPHHQRNNRHPPLPLPGGD